MLKKIFFVLGLLLQLPVQATSYSFQSLCYHDVRDDVYKNLDSDSGAMSTDRLIGHFSWFKEHGFMPVSMEDILDARDGKKPLPDKALLLTFDDGYTSFYNRVFPLLKLFNYPAVLALQTGWLSTPPDGTIQYGSRSTRKRDFFLEWGQIREMQASGLVEMASHSNGLHHGVVSNPQGNLQAAAITRIYDKKTQKYETDEQYQQRIQTDLDTSADIIEKHTGIRPRIIVWPYGAYTENTVNIAKQAGMPISFSLDDGQDIGFANTGNLNNVGRMLIDANINTNDLNWSLRHWQKADPQRIMQIDLDLLYDDDPKKQQKKMDILIERVKEMAINTVYLQAFSDPDGDGNADALYFPNRHLPMRADLFNRVAWQLNTRAGGVKIYAWMPVMAYVLPDKALNEKLLVKEWHNGTIRPAKNDYYRLSFFHPETRKIIGDIYEDLAKQAHFNGLFFQDDAYLNDFEDVSAAAVAYYVKQGLPASITEIRSHPDLMEKWAEVKTQAMIDFTHELVKRANLYRPVLKTARNIYAEAVLNPDAKEWYAQSLSSFLDAYDYPVIMAYTRMEGAKDDEEWLKQLLEQVTEETKGLKNTVIKLQAVDWQKNEPIPAKTLVRQMHWLQRHGALNLAYYPDNFPENLPQLKMVKQGLSLETFPYPKP